MLLLLIFLPIEVPFLGQRKVFVVTLILHSEIEKVGSSHLPRWSILTKLYILVVEIQTGSTDGPR